MILDNKKNIKKINNKINISRRDFIKFVGFSTAAVTLAACKGKVIHSIPYITNPETIIPGVPNYYATTMFDGFDLRSVLVKTREGRPIKIEGNKISKYFNNSSVRIEASLLSLYDNERIDGPYIKGEKSSWKEVDFYINKKFNKILKNGKKIVILSSSFPSPSTKKIFKEFTQIYPNTHWIIYDPLSYSNALDASEEILGVRGFPKYDLSNIELIVSFNADFLSDWYPESMQKDYSNRKLPKFNMLRHIQLESNMTISGANADIRIPLKPSICKKFLLEIYHCIIFNKQSKNNIIQNIVNQILNKKSKTVIFAGDDKESYIIALLINKYINSLALLQNKFFLNKESNNLIFENFINDLSNDKIGALLLFNSNPIYNLPQSKRIKFIKNIKKLDLSISFSIDKNESSNFMKVLTPTHHWLESWGDTHPINGFYTLMQPTIHPIFNTRQFQDSLLIWKDFNHNKKLLHNHSDLYNNINNNINNNYYNFLKNYWENNILSKLKNKISFNDALFNGVIEINENIIINKNIDYKKYFHKDIFNQKRNIGYELILYPKLGLGDGTQFNNPWLQEFPDPITRTTWDNYITISPIDAKLLNLKNWYTTSGALNGDTVNLTNKNFNINIKNIPIYIQPGQANGSLGLAIGYGHNITKYKSGINAYILYENYNHIQYDINIKKSNKIHKFACIQLQNTLVGRNSIARETNLQTFMNHSKEVWNKEEKINSYKGKIKIDESSIWKNHKYDGHHFNLSIDLNSCIGCGTCVLACNVENNIPIVGKDEIRNSRDMHWLRIDRYYSTEEDFNSLDKLNLSERNPFSEPKMYKFLTNPKNNPNVIFQPIMCQHCNNAPCETVCPVAATSHGSQGQNMMTYNRCIGTRYCANNCPYKVRRFNWFQYVDNKNFDYHMNNDLGKMVLNPDVVVRSRGVMEKCSMCIQMTQSVILEAKKENRKIKDKEFQTACSNACPTNAIIFGDINDKTSEIYKKSNNDRTYKLLDFIGTKPNVIYHVKIRNSD